MVGSDKLIRVERVDKVASEKLLLGEGRVRVDETDGGNDQDGSETVRAGGTLLGDMTVRLSLGAGLTGYKEEEEDSEDIVVNDGDDPVIIGADG